MLRGRVLVLVACRIRQPIRFHTTTTHTRKRTMASPWETTQIYHHMSDLGIFDSVPRKTIPHPTKGLRMALLHFRGSIDSTPAASVLPSHRPPRVSMETRLNSSTLRHRHQLLDILLSITQPLDIHLTPNNSRISMRRLRTRLPTRSSRKQPSRLRHIRRVQSHRSQVTHRLQNRRRPQPTSVQYRVQMVRTLSRSPLAAYSRPVSAQCQEWIDSPSVAIVRI